MIKRFLLAFATAAVLAGCGSNVKLDDVPVEDKSATSVIAPGANSGTTAPTTQSGVTPVAVDPNAGAQPGPAGVERIVYFDYDSYAIKPQYQSLVEAHSRFLKANTGRRISIEGHTDDRGGREYNLALGQKRSEAVRSALKLLGVPDSQVEAVSFGKEKPSDMGADEAAWAKNRRAEIAYR